VTAFAVSTGEAILAWIGLGLGLVVAVLVVALFNRVVRPALEIERYAERILQGGVGIAKNLDDAGEIERTRQLATAIPDLAGAYLRKLQGS
jgi:hypothetical protein